MSKRKVYGLFGAMWAVALTLSMPAMAAAPAGHQEANIGAPDTDGGTEVTGNSWTVSGSGNDFNGATEDQLYFVYKTIKGNGSVRARLVGEEQPSQYVGVMIRESLNANAPMAGLIMSTSALNWITRPAADEAATRLSGVSPEAYPKDMLVQRVGNTITGFTSDDGVFWRQIAGPITLPLAETAVIGVAVSSRGGDAITVELENVQIVEGAVVVPGVEGAANEKLAFIAWDPIPTAAGYNIYRGPRGAALDKMTLLHTAAPGDSSYLDNAASETPLRNFSYAVVGVFKAADGSTVMGPAARAR